MDRFAVMAYCWAMSAAERPTFSQLLVCLQEFYAQLTRYVWAHRQSSVTTFLPSLYLNQHLCTCVQYSTINIILIYVKMALTLFSTGTVPLNFYTVNLFLKCSKLLRNLFLHLYKHFLLNTGVCFISYTVYTCYFELIKKCIYCSYVQLVL